MVTEVRTLPMNLRTTLTKTLNEISSRLFLLILLNCNLAYGLSPHGERRNAKWNVLDSVHLQSNAFARTHALLYPSWWPWLSNLHVHIIHPFNLPHNALFKSNTPRKYIPNLHFPLYPTLMPYKCIYLSYWNTNSIQHHHWQYTNSLCNWCTRHSLLYLDNFVLGTARQNGEKNMFLLRYFVWRRKTFFVHCVETFHFASIVFFAAIIIIIIIGNSHGSASI